MKRYTCISTSLLQLILCALLSSAAALPTLISLVDPPILPPANGTPTSIGLVPLGTALPFHYQNIVLVFTNFGKSIPQNEVVDTLAGADRIVTDYSFIEPQRGIPNNRFEYRTPQGNVLLAIGGPVGKDITWRQLYRVLQALIRFMTVLTPPAGPHYQELHFEIQISEEGGSFGNGVVWYFRPGSEEVLNGTTTNPVLTVSNGTLLQKRATTTPLLAVSDSSLLAFNESSNLTLPLGSDDQIFFPIPGTSMTLDFYYLGLGLPRALVEANLAGALIEARKYSGGPFQHHMITRNCFFLVTSGATSRVATTVYPVNDHQISWLELFNVLDGLRQFVLGVNEENTHFQTLGYRVLDNIQGKISVGTLSYYDPGPPPVERRAMADREGSVGPALTQIAKPTNQSFLRVTKEPTPLPIPWPIPETDLTLIFTVAGLGIPLVEILALLAATQLRIAASVAGTPGGAVGTFRLQNEPGTLIISFLTYPGKVVTWLELHQVLVGLGLFLNEASHSRACAFHIVATEQGSIGHGIIAHGPGQALLQRRALGRGYLSKSNSTSLSPEHTTTIPWRYPSYAIPGTPITLEFFFIGSSAISPIDLGAVLTSVLQVIEPHVVHEGARAIPEQWVYRDRMTNISFEAVVYPGRTLSWQQLNWVIIGLLHWMTGPGLSNCKNLTFGIAIMGEEVGIGSVFNYFATPIAGTKGDDPASPFDIVLSYVGIVGKGDLVSGNSLERRATQSPNPAEEGVLPQGDLTSPWLSQLPTQNISARPTNAMLQLITPFHIPGSPITITITRLLQTAVPAVSLMDLFRGAHQLVQKEVSQRPQEYITTGYFYYEVPSLEGYLAAVAVDSVPGHTITWLELDKTLRRLESIVTRKTTQTQFRQNLLSKGNINIAEWSTAQEQLGHTEYLPETLVARSVLSSTGTNLTAPIPYPIPDTIITLQIRLLPPTIPASRLNDLFNNVHLTLRVNVRDHPDEYYNKDAFFSEVKYLDSREIIAIEVYPQLDEHLTWLQLSQTLNGLQLFLNGADGRPFRQAVFFTAYINGVSVAYGSLSYIFPSPTSTLKPRSVPPSNANLPDPIPYPIIGTPITLAITSLLPTPIPIERVIQFFNLAIDAIRAEIDNRGPHSSVGLIWVYRQDFAPGFEMSIKIRRVIGKLFAWKTLAQALDGLEDFMEGKYRPTESLQALDFDIEIVERGVVASGELSYRTGLSGLGEEAGNSSVSNSSSLSFSGFGEEAGNSSLSNPVSTS